MVLAALSACGQQQEAQTPAAGSSAGAAAPASAPAQEAKASAPADTPLGGNLGAAADAVWLSYQCAEGKTLDARYYRNEAGAPAAEVRFDGQTQVLPYSAEFSNEDLTAFGNGKFSWTVSNEHQIDFYKENNGFLVRHEKQQMGSEVLPADDIVMKNCMPAQ